MCVDVQQLEVGKRRKEFARCEMRVLAAAGSGGHRQAVAAAAARDWLAKCAPANLNSAAANPASTTTTVGSETRHISAAHCIICITLRTGQ